MPRMTRDNKQNNRPVQFGGGFFRHLGDELRLVIRLMKDPRISMWLKALPFTSLLYFIIPDIAPGPIDDTLIIGVGVYLFLELCPPEIVDEHRRELRRTVNGQWRDPEPEGKAEIIEGEFKEE